MAIQAIVDRQDIRDSRDRAAIQERVDTAVLLASQVTRATQEQVVIQGSQVVAGIQDSRGRQEEVVVVGTQTSQKTWE